MLTRVRIDRIWRHAGSALIIILAMMLSACVPTRPPENYPVALTVVGPEKKLAFVQCVASELAVFEMGVYASGVRWSDEEGHFATLVLTETGDEPLLIDNRTMIVGDSLAPLKAVENVGLSAGDLIVPSPMTITLTTSGGVGRVRFERVDLAALNIGDYLYSTGEVSREPCAMAGGIDATVSP